VEIVYPVHPHPSVEGLARRVLWNVDRINLTPPLCFEEFLHLEKESYLILTDSGGLQEEAPCLKKPVLVFRNITEREDGLKSGSVKLVGTLAPEIIKETERLLDDHSEYERMASAPNPYGNEGAAKRIARHVWDFLSNGKLH
jgi:UDP-N-acetylglucosamine 2-epimerase (non-hydrolysing)